MSKLIGFDYFLLRYSIVSLDSFSHFTAFINISLTIVIASNIIVNKMFCQRSEIKVAKTLISQVSFVVSV